MDFVEFTTEEYPELLKDNIGCCVPAPWAPIIKSALDEMEELRKTGVTFTVAQIKEKFGSLRLYVRGISDYSLVEDIIIRADEETSKTCAVCGSHDDVKIGTRNKDSGWVLTLCKEHRYQRDK